jgi:hypothetical protein
MEDAQAFLRHPEIGFLSMLLVGAILILFVWHRVHHPGMTPRDWRRQ